VITRIARTLLLSLVVFIHVSLLVFLGLLWWTSGTVRVATIGLSAAWQRLSWSAARVLPGVGPRCHHEAVGKVDEDTQRRYGLGWDDLLGVRLKALVEDGTR
jgi:hypothetical protein